MPDGGEVWALIIAAGRSVRFGRPKLLARLGGHRLVDITVDTARRVCDRVALVLPAGMSWDGPPVDELGVGGEHRSDSVRCGLTVVPPSAEIIVIADPAHPLASPALFESVISAVRQGADGAVPAVETAEIIQRVRDGLVKQTLAKDDLVITQSPHAFRADALRAVHAERPRSVEDSSLLVDHGYAVRMVPGDPANLHVTTPYELELAARLHRPPE